MGTGSLGSPLNNERKDSWTQAAWPGGADNRQSG